MQQKTLQFIRAIAEQLLGTLVVMDDSGLAIDQDRGVRDLIQESRAGKRIHGFSG